MVDGLRDVSFSSSGTRCAGWHLPATSTALARPTGRPALVMAHGFGCTRDSGLLPFAERFAASGLDVLLFDYRGFGASDGQPRQAISHRRQRADYHAAVAAARSFEGVDPARIALWGTSYSGGHVVAVAAQDPRIAALVSQGAAVDGMAILRKPERADPTASRSKGPRMVLAALRDVGRALTRRTPYLVDAVGAPGDFAMLTDASSFEEYLAMMGPSWRNEVCARSLLGVPFNRPVRLAAEVRCPALFVIAEQDTIAPPAAVRETARLMGARAETLSFDCPHFDIYRGEVFERSVERQVAFLTRHLGQNPAQAGL